MPVIATIAGLYLSNFAFTKRVRQEIIDRDKRCIWYDDTCNGYIEASHINHRKDEPYYNDPRNGVALCTKHHADHHELTEGKNGLAKHHNNWAIKMIRKKLK